jgi:hypothetical protein
MFRRKSLLKTAGLAEQYARLSDLSTKTLRRKREGRERLHRERHSVSGTLALSLPGNDRWSTQSGIASEQVAAARKRKLFLVHETGSISEGSGPFATEVRKMAAPAGKGAWRPVQRALANPYGRGKSCIAVPRKKRQATPKAPEKRAVV